MIGTSLFHYRIVEQLGEGGMGVVDKAQDTHLDRLVAIKVMPPGKTADPERKARFVQEAKAASALNHPTIIRVYDISAEAIEIWIAAADGSRPAQLTREAGRGQGTVPWSPDGRLIAFDPLGQDAICYIGRTGPDRQYPIQFYEFSTNASKLLTRVDGSLQHGLSVSPDRKTIPFSSVETYGADLMLIENFRKAAPQFQRGEERCDPSSCSQS